MNRRRLWCVVFGHLWLPSGRRDRHEARCWRCGEHRWRSTPTLADLELWHAEGRGDPEVQDLS